MEDFLSSPMIAISLSLPLSLSVGKLPPQEEAEETRKWIHLVCGFLYKGGRRENGTRAR